VAWIESHQGLAKHPKTLKLARKLNINIAQAIGHLHLFWWWAMEYAQDGDLSHCDPEDIAIAADWPGDAGLFVDSLVDSGFVDRGDDGNLSIHDWYEYAGKLIERRIADAERKRKERKKKDVHKTSAGHPQDVERTSDVTLTVPKPSNDGLMDNAPARETFEQAHKRVFGFHCNPMQSQQLSSYIEDGMDEAVIIRAFERASDTGKTGYNFKFIRAIVENYFKNGVRTLEQAIKLDDAHDAARQNRGDPVRKSRQQQQLDELDKFIAEEEMRRGQSRDRPPFQEDQAVFPGV
jgi:DnaD/phage-associated family protein